MICTLLAFSGLVLATKKFDPDRGIRVRRLRQHWIKGQILELFKPKGGAPGRAISLDAPAFKKEDEHGNTKLDYIIDDRPADATIDVGDLSDRERAIFGAQSRGKNTREIGNDLGISGERARQINRERSRRSGPRRATSPGPVSATYLSAEVTGSQVVRFCHSRQKSGDMNVGF